LGLTLLLVRGEPYASRLQKAFGSFARERFEQKEVVELPLDSLTLPVSNFALF